MKGRRSHCWPATLSEGLLLTRRAVFSMIGLCGNFGGSKALLWTVTPGSTTQPIWPVSGVRGPDLWVVGILTPRAVAPLRIRVAGTPQYDQSRGRWLCEVSKEEWK